VCVLVVATAVVHANGHDRHLNRLPKIFRVDIVCVRSEPMLDLSKGGLDRRHVRRVGRSGQKTVPSSSEGCLSDVVCKVRRQVVAHDRAPYARCQLWNEDIAEVRCEEVCGRVVVVDEPGDRADVDVNGQ